MEVFLNRIGEDGWELVTAIVLWNTSKLTYIFKRKLSERVEISGKLIDKSKEHE
jgi:hypothetical protein